jgi:hypothetical protein
MALRPGGLALSQPTDQDAGLTARAKAMEPFTANARWSSPSWLEAFVVFTYLVYPDTDGWRVQLQDAATATPLSTFAAAERRARWLAARASVQGHESEVLLLDAAGDLVGRWWAEAYTPAAAPACGVAA